VKKRGLKFLATAVKKKGRVGELGEDKL